MAQYDVSNRSAIVTGAGSGIGRSTALLLAKNGASVVVNDLNAEHANALVEEIKAIAGETNARPAQVALAWVLGRAPNIHVIPGTTKLENLTTNIGAATLVLSPGQVRRLDALAARVSGPRYTPIAMSAVNL